MTAVTKAPQDSVVRPLAVLVRLIKEDLQHGHDEAERAGMPYYRAAGEKLLEANSQMTHVEFKAWVKRNFSMSYETARQYMRSAEQPVGKHATLTAVLRESNPNYNRPPTWHEPVQKIIGRVDTETLNLKREELKRADERDAQRQLALQLIDIGYKVLARKLHPDRGGSRDAMARLNAVRDRLKQHA